MTLPGNLPWQVGTLHVPVDPLKADDSDLVMNSVCRFAYLFYEHDAFQKKHGKKIYMATIFLFLKSFLMTL